MAYQPNEFVNPEQRGVELPPGCKDLNDLLKAGAQKRMPRPNYPVQRGRLNDVPRYVQDLYMEHYGLSLVVIVPGAEAIVWVHNRYRGCRLTVLLRKQDTSLATFIQDFFGIVGVDEAANEKSKLVTVPMPHLWLEAAQIVQIVIRSYGVPENAGLLFHFVRVTQ